MQYLSNIYPMGSYHHQDSYNSVLEGVVLNTSAIEMFNIENSNDSTISYADAKAIAANKSHSEAERRRRRRINGHLATLRTLVPNTIKADKASLLGEVVRCLRELKQKTSELGSPTENADDGLSYHLDSDTSTSVIDTETESLNLTYMDEEGGLVEATLWCEDRPQMMKDLTRVLNSVEAKVVRAEMSRIGGRTKVMFWLQVSVFGEEGLETLRRALKMVLDNKSIPLAAADHGHVLLGNKRSRLNNGVNSLGKGHFSQSVTLTNCNDSTNLKLSDIIQW